MMRIKTSFSGSKKWVTISKRGNTEDLPLEPRRDFQHIGVRISRSSLPISSCSHWISVNTSLLLTSYVGYQGQSRRSWLSAMYVTCIKQWVQKSLSNSYICRFVMADILSKVRTDMCMCSQLVESCKVEVQQLQVVTVCTNPKFCPRGKTTELFGSINKLLQGLLWQQSIKYRQRNNMIIQIKVSLLSFYREKRGIFFANFIAIAILHRDRDEFIAVAMIHCNRDEFISVIM